MENSKKRVYTPEQKERRRIWQNERRRLTNYEDYKKYYPKLKERRQLKALENLAVRKAKLELASQKRKEIKEASKKQKSIKPKVKKHQVQNSKLIVKAVKEKYYKPKIKEKKFETINQDLSQMKQVLIKELNMSVFIRADQDEQKIRNKYLNRFK